MQIQAVQTLSPVATPSGGQSPLDAFAPGDTIQAEVASASQGRVVLQLPGGGTIEASQRTMDPLQAGDQVLLMVSQDAESNAPRLELLSVNGQPVKAGALPLEYALMRIQVPPTQGNLSIASALMHAGAPLRPETFARMEELALRFVNLSPDTALAFAASSLPMDAPTVEAFSQWIQNPVGPSDLAAASLHLAAQDPQAAHILESVAAQLLSASPLPEQSGTAPLPTSALPEGLSPSLAAKLEQSGVWQELQASLPVLPENEARGHILQLMSDLPLGTTSQERSILYAALNAMRSVQTAPEGAPGASTAPPAAGSKDVYKRQQLTVSLAKGLYSRCTFH